MAQIPGTNVVAPVVPFDTTDTHPSHDALYGKGGYRTVATTGERNAIPAARRAAGMLVFVLASGGSTWRLGDDLVTWTEVTGGGGGAGATGPTGAAGASGGVGATGPQGQQGTPGATGAQGEPGATGPQGIPGAAGATGAQGIQGVTGPQGQPGATGAQGEPGATGATGAQGAQGEQGQVGATGPQGLQGVQGVTGPQGQQGVAGVTGAQGASITGPTGPAGSGGGGSSTPTVTAATPFAANTTVTGFNTGDFSIIRISVTGTTGVNLRGLGATAADGTGRLLINVGTTAPVTLQHATGTFGNAQFSVPWKGDYAVSAEGGAALVIYDTTSAVWRIV